MHGVPSPRPPLVRARYMQSFMKGLSRLHEADRVAITAALPPRTLASIVEAPMLGWLPFAVNLECTTAVAARLGRERGDAFFRALILEVTDTPLLHGFVRSALRVTSRDPGMYLPWIGKGWELIFRDVGRFSARRRGAMGAVLELRGLPPEAMAERVWIDRVAVSIGALAELLDFDAAVVTGSMDTQNSAVSFVANWRTRETAGVR